MAKRTNSAWIIAVLVVCLAGVSLGDSITLQPDGDAGKDVLVTNAMGFLFYVINYDRALVYGLNAALYSGVSLVQFDPPLPSSVTVTSAVMGIYAYEVAAPGDYIIAEVTEPWIEPPFDANGAVTANWPAFPTVNPTIVDTATPAVGTPDWLLWDVTSLVSNWVDGSSPNNGVMIITETGSMAFWTSDYTAEPTLRPYLQITYTPEPITLTLLAFSALTIIRRRIPRTATALPRKTRK